MIIKIDIIIIVIFVSELNSMLTKEKVWTTYCLGILWLAASCPKIEPECASVEIGMKTHSNCMENKNIHSSRI